MVYYRAQFGIALDTVILLFLFSPCHLFSRKCWLPHLPQRQYVAFVLFAFTFEVSLYANYNLKSNGNHAKQYPACTHCNYYSVLSLTRKEMSWWRHLRNPAPLSWEQQSYPGTTWASIEDDHIKRRPRPSPYHDWKPFFLSVQVGVGVDQAKWTPIFVRTVQRRL